MNHFYYVYIPKDIATDSHHYVGYTCDIKARLKVHNSGQVPHTKKYRPWRISTCTAFLEKEKAIAFEKYLKSGSGRAFAKRHF